MDLSKLLDELYDDDGGEPQGGEEGRPAVPEPAPTPPSAASAPPSGPAPALDPLAADPELAAWLAEMAERREATDESAAAPGPGMEVNPPEPEGAVRLDEAVPEEEVVPEPEPEPEAEAVSEPETLPLQDDPVAEPEAAAFEPSATEPYPAPTPATDQLPTELEPGRRWRRNDDDILPGRSARPDDRSAASGGERRGRWWGLRRRS